MATTASGILFTNENAVNADVYAERRAVKYDMDNIHVWKDHLIKSGVSSVLPCKLGLSSGEVIEMT